MTANVKCTFKKSDFYSTIRRAAFRHRLAIIQRRRSLSSWGPEKFWFYKIWNNPKICEKRFHVFNQ